jgi:hypothetical protein
MINRLKKHATALLGVVLLSGILLVSGCSKSTEPDFVTQVSLSSVFEDDQLASDVSRVTLTVTLADVVVLTQDMAFSEGAVQEAVEVPPGQNILFTLNAYDSAGRLLYSGSATADVGLGSDIEVNIQMLPQVLMLKIDPLFQVADSRVDSSYYFDVYVYNVQNLFGASFRIEYSPNVISPTNVEIGGFLGEQPVSLVRMGSGFVAIGITRVQGQLGVSGSGHLARIYFTPMADGATDLSFNLETVSLADPAGNPVNGFSGLVLEWGQIVVASPIP